MRFNFRNSIKLNLFEALHFFKDSIFFLILSMIYLSKIVFYSKVETIIDDFKFSIFYSLLSILLYTYKKCCLKFKILKVKNSVLDIDDILEIIKAKKWVLETRLDEFIVFRTPISACGNSIYRGGEFVYLKIVDNTIHYKSIYNYYSIWFILNINESKLNEEYIYKELIKKYPDSELIQSSCLN